LRAFQRGAAICEKALGAGDERDHALVRFARRLSEREDAVIHEHHADRAGM
jgi:hypothetical protein